MWKNGSPKTPYTVGEIWGDLLRTKLKEGIPSEINSAQFPREPSTAKSTPLHKGAIECTPRITKRSALSHKSINGSAPRTPKRQERALGRRKGPGAHKGTRPDRP